MPWATGREAAITLPVGTYTWFVNAYDDAGNPAKSTAKKLIVK
jgi:hypothetical protein